jgi:putative ubiquitin-RnfH superfamily antitoxin RatB of RatAB toxin-antitoxin module
MGRAEAAPHLSVQVAWSPRPGVAEETRVRLEAGATLLDALRASGALEPGAVLGELEGSVGIWGRLRPLDAVLQPGDRVELYRPLEIDPKEARRQRQRRQREAAATQKPRPSSGNRPR